MIKFSNVLVISSSVLLFSGCLMTRDDIQEEEQKKVVQQQVTSLQKNNADVQSRTTELNEEIREIHGKTESLENKIQTQNKEREKVQNLTDQQLAETNKKVFALQEEVQKLSNQVGFLNQELVKISQAQAAAPMAGAAESTKGGKEKKTEAFKNAEEAFAKKDWRNAILNYESYRKNYPKGKNFEMATFKIALCFKELGMKDEAKTFFEEVISSFPDTALAKQAKDQLKKKRE